jgi:quercetin dioxygenase-like cupin family protein
MSLIESKTVTAKNKAGGKGEIYITHLLTQKEMVGQCGMFAEVVIPPSASIGPHYHYGDSETYHILQGKARYNDNDKFYEVGAGETTFCASNSMHGIENIGDEDLIFIALIIKNPA